MATVNPADVVQLSSGKLKGSYVYRTVIVNLEDRKQFIAGEEQPMKDEFMDSLIRYKEQSEEVFKLMFIDYVDWLDGN